MPVERSIVGTGRRRGQGNRTADTTRFRESCPEGPSGIHPGPHPGATARRSGSIVRCPPDTSRSRSKPGGPWARTNGANATPPRAPRDRDVRASATGAGAGRSKRRPFRTAIRIARRRGASRSWRPRRGRRGEWNAAACQRLGDEASHGLPFSVLTATRDGAAALTIPEVTTRWSDHFDGEGASPCGASGFTGRGDSAWLTAHWGWIPGAGVHRLLAHRTDRTVRDRDMPVFLTHDDDPFQELRRRPCGAGDGPRRPRTPGWINSDPARLLRDSRPPLLHTRHRSRRH